MKRFIQLFLWITLISSLSPYITTAAEVREVRKLQNVFKESNEIAKKINFEFGGEITDSELSGFRYQIKILLKQLESYSNYLKSDITKNELIIDNLNKYGLKNIEEGSKGIIDEEFIQLIKNIKTEIKTSRILLLKSILTVNNLDELVIKISSRQLELRSKDLFVYNLPFYKLNAWITDYKDIIQFIGNSKGELKGFYSAIKNSDIKSYSIITLLIVLIIAVIFIRYSRKLNSILFADRTQKNEIRSYSDFISSDEFSIFIIFFKNAFLPSLLILWLGISFISGYNFPDQNLCIQLIKNIITSIVYILIFRTIISIYFNYKLQLIPDEIINKKYFKKRWFLLVYLIAILFTINNIDIVDISATINPVLKPNATALLNFIIGAAIFYNIIIISLTVKKYLNSYCERFLKLYKFINNVFLFIGFLIPFLTFFGASNFSTGLILNFNQCFLVIFLLWMIYNVFKNLHPLLSCYISNYFYNVSKDVEKPEPTSEEIETPLFSYWLNVLIILIFSILYIILFLLIWGVPPSAVYDWIELLFFKGIPLGNNTSFSLLFLVRAVLVGSITFYTFKLIKILFDIKVLPYTKFDHGTKQAIIITIGYLGIISSFILFIYSLGISGTTLTFVISGLSIGIGFSLQELFKNFFSGFVLLIERPIKIGDFLNINDKTVIVQKIKIRATEVVTLSKDTLIIPNSELINSTVINETLDPKTRVDVSIGVSYSSDPEIIVKILYEVAAANKEVYKRPASLVEFQDFGDSSLNFILRAFTARQNKIRVASDLRLAIFARFRKENITIPFPQRDVNIKYEDNDRNSKNKPVSDIINNE